MWMVVEDLFRRDIRHRSQFDNKGDLCYHKDGRGAVRWVAALVVRALLRHNRKTRGIP